MSSSRSQTRWRACPTTVFGSTSTTTRRTCLEGVKAGTYDLGWNGPANWHQLGVTTFDALAAPFLIDTYDLEAKVLSSSIPTKALVGLEPVGLVGIGIQPGPLKLLSAADHALLAPSDFVGQTIGIGPEPITADAMKALGAKTIEITSDSSLEGVDGVEAQLQAIIGNHYQTVMSHTATNVPLIARPVVYFANPTKFRSLSEADQQAMRLAVQQSAAAALGNLAQVEDAAFSALCANGSELAEANAADLTALRAAVQPVYDELRRDPATASAIDEIEAIKAGLSPSASSPLVPSGRCFAGDHRVAQPRGRSLISRCRVPGRRVRGNDHGRADGGLLEALLDPARCADDVPLHGRLHVPGRGHDGWRQRSLVLQLLRRPRHHRGPGFGRWRLYGPLGIRWQAADLQRHGRG